MLKTARWMFDLKKKKKKIMSRMWNVEWSLLFWYMLLYAYLPTESTSWWWFFVYIFLQMVKWVHHKVFGLVWSPVSVVSAYFKTYLSCVSFYFLWFCLNQLNFFALLCQWWYRLNGQLYNWPAIIHSPHKLISYLKWMCFVE